MAAYLSAELLTTSRKLRDGFEEAKKLLSFLLRVYSEGTESDRQISSFGLSAALKHLLKAAGIPEFFIASNGMQTLNLILRKEKEDKQTCYNLLVCFWIISLKPFARKIFENRDNEFLENIIRILQLHGNENIIRVISHIFKVSYYYASIGRTFATIRILLSICWTAI